MSAAARLRAFLLCEVKMEGLVLEGRGRAVVVLWGRVLERREVSWEVNAKVVEEGISLAVDRWGRGMP